MTTTRSALRPAVSPLIRSARPEDAEALAALKLATFRETFVEGFRVPYPPADLARFEAETYGIARVTAELADCAHHSWVAEDAARPGGFLAYAHVGPCKLPHPAVAAGELELYQIYLRGNAQGMGLGKRLLALASDYIERAGSRVWLGVWSGNFKAQAFYLSAGFEQVGEYKFPVGDWYDDELIFRRDLPAGCRETTVS